MMNYNTMHSTIDTTQDQVIPGREKEMQKNHEGNYVFKVSPMNILERFLILGTTSSTYYASKSQSFNEIIPDIQKLIDTDGINVVDKVVEISSEGRAPKNDEAIFVLGLCASSKDKNTRRYALSRLKEVCRIGTHLFQFMDVIKHHRGTGRLVKEAINNWYLSKDISTLAYQLVKYQQRNGWSHKDILKLTRPKPKSNDQQEVLGWVLGKVKYDKGFIRPAIKPATYNIKGVDHESKGSPLKQVEWPFEAESILGFELAKNAKSAKDISSLIQDYRLTREMIPTEFLKDPKVWSALLSKMPMTAMIRNLGNMGSCGLVGPLSEASKTVINKLTTVDLIKKSRLHPVSIINAMMTYKMGRGIKGSNTWKVDSNVVEALEYAFYKSFDFIEPTGKNFLLGLDVSSSMTWGNGIGGVIGFTPNVASSVLAMATIKSEKFCHIVGFTGEIKDLGITSNDSLSEVMRKTKSQSFGRTDCAKLFKYAKDAKLLVDTFATYTDNETNSGHRSRQPSLELASYRSNMGRKSAAIVVGMTATSSTIADPKDPLMLDIVGFNTNVPSIISSLGG